VKRLIALFAAMMCLTGSGYPTHSSLEALYAYHHYGFYDRDVAAALDHASRYVAALTPGASKPALVLDIDETSLSNWELLEHNNLMPSNILYGRYQQGDVIPGALRLFNIAKEKNIAVIFLTGRNEATRGQTIGNLHRAGYRGWTALIMRTDKDVLETNARFKALQRKQLEQQGYTILATVGDQQSDLSGGHTGKAFRVPNPYYNLP
jgi:acid phosphatase